MGSIVEKESEGIQEIGGRKKILGTTSFNHDLVSVDISKPRLAQVALVKLCGTQNLKKWWTGKRFERKGPGRSWRKRKEDEEMSNQNSLDTGKKCQIWNLLIKEDMYNINETYS